MIWYVVYNRELGWHIISRSAWGMIEHKELYQRFSQEFSSKEKAEHFAAELNLRNMV